MLNYKTKNVLKGFNAESYVKECQDDSGLLEGVIDCSLGVNPFGCSTLFQYYKRDFFDRFSINDYPDFPYTRFKKEIVDYWKDFSNLDVSYIKFGTGSIGVLLTINRMFIEKGTWVLGSCPTFTPYVSDIKLNEGIFDYVLLEQEANYKFNYKALYSKIDKKYTLIYLDNPNNPTGQIIPLPVIKSIIEKAQKDDACVLIDEAYGDFMDEGNSAISLINQFENLMVVRSFSKAFGLAGLRVGYLITSKALSHIYSLVDTPFTISTAGEYAAICSMKDRDFIISSREKVRGVKEKVMGAFKKMKVLETSSQVPIMTIQHPDKNADLYKLFRMHNVLTEKGTDFTGLGNNYVRMRIPSDPQAITGIIEKIENEI